MNIIQKSLILGAQGAVIIILAYLIALSEIELSINIPAMVAPTSSVVKVSAEKAVVSTEEEISTSSPIISKIKKELLACTESTETIFSYVAPLPFVAWMKADITTSFKIKGLDEVGFCHVEQETIKLLVTLTPEDRQAMLAEEAVTEEEIDNMLREMNQEYQEIPDMVTDCYGAAENLLAYFQTLEEGGSVGGVSIHLSTRDGSIQTMKDYEVTCVTPGVVIVSTKKQEEASSTDEVLDIEEEIVIPEN